MKYLILGAACLWLGLGALSPVSAQEADPSPPKPRPFAFIPAEPLVEEVPDFTVVKKRFHADLLEGEHRDLINISILPFTQRNVSSETNHVAHAFSFLLSLDMDWHPAVQVDKHAYYQFKQEPEVMTFAGKERNTRAVVLVPQRWLSTHVVGGELVRQGEQFTCNWSLFNHLGIPLTGGTEGPGDFFDVLGSTSCALMKALDYKPTEKLSNYLKAPRCSSMELINKLDTAAFVEPRSDREFDIYKDILNSDPAFAEVRYWYAKQYFWTTKDKQRLREEQYRSLNDRIVMDAYRYSVQFKTGINNAEAGYPYWENILEEIFPDGHPKITAGKIRRLHQGHIPFIPNQVLHSGMAYAGDYPWLNELTSPLGHLLAGNRIGASDHTMAAALALPRIERPYQPHDDEKRKLDHMVGMACLYSGKGLWADYFFKDAVLHALPDGPKYSEYYTIYAMYSLVLNGRFESAARMGEYMIQNFEIRDTQRACLQISALIAGRIDLWERFRDPNQYQKRPEYGVLVNDFKNYVLHNRAPSTTERLFPYTTKKDPSSTSMLTDSSFGASVIGALQEVLLTDHAIRGGHKTSIEMTLFESFPGCRLLWYTLDARERARPGIYRIECFYEVLEWLHKDDPWVQKAVKDFRERKAAAQNYSYGRREIIEEKFDRAYEEYQNLSAKPDTIAEEWPVLRTAKVRSNLSVSHLMEFYSKAWLVKQLLDEQRYDKAEFVSFIGLISTAPHVHYARRSMFNDLFHLVARAKKHQCGSNIPGL